MLEKASKKYFINHIYNCEVTEWTRLYGNYTKFADLPRDLLENIQRFYGGIVAVLQKIVEAKSESDISIELKVKKIKISLDVLLASFSKIENWPRLLMNKIIEDVYAELIKLM